MYCYISHNYRNFTHAGTKSKAYNEQIFQSMGFKNIALPQTHFQNTIFGFLATLTGVILAVLRINKGDVLVLQYPIKKYYTFICRVAHFKGAKIITLIHDLGSFRRKKLTPEKEMQRLNNSDYIIAHNENMKRWLNEHGRTEGVGIHRMHDYISEAQAPVRNTPEKRASILYAGSLPRKKNAFLYTLAEEDRGYDLELYGKGLNAAEIKSDSVHYHGFIPDEELIENTKYNYGLVWDGPSLDACEGDFGEYLRYNNPLKASLYIRCHLPLIVWEKAAIAPLVREKGIGICVNTLRDLDKTLKGISAQKYTEMENNVIAWSKELKNGNCTRNAIKEALKYLENKR